MANKQKAKGDKYEREIAAHINQATGLSCSRTPLSGAAGGSDLRDTPGLAVECKRQETLSFPAAMEQAEKAAVGDEMAVVINRRSYQSTGQSFALVRLDTLLVMYNAWLKEQGLGGLGNHESGDGHESVVLPNAPLCEDDDALAVARIILGDNGLCEDKPTDV